MKKTFIFLVLSFSALTVLAACPGHAPPDPHPKPPPHMEYQDAATADESDADVASLSEEGRACRRLRDFRCPEGNRTRFNTPCVEWMRNAGKLVDVRCIASAQTRAALLACNVRCIE